MKKKSPSYPSKSLPEAEKFAITVFEKVGDSILQFSDLAKNGNIPVREADNFASTATQYGWMTQIRGKGFSPNNAVCTALRTPKNSEEKNKLYLTAFQTPPLYKFIINEWNGKNITEEGLKISLIRDREFTDSGAIRASQVFIANAKFLGILDDENNLNIEADININPIPIKEKRHVTVKSSEQSPNKKSATDKAKQFKPDEIITPKLNGNLGSMKKISVFVRGQELHFSVPDEMSQSDWDAVIKQFQNIKSFAK